jgi:hypothetical protein
MSDDLLTGQQTSANGHRSGYTPAFDRLRDKLREHEPSGRLSAMLAGTYRNGPRHAAYGLVLEDGTEVDLGKAENVLRPVVCQAAILDATGIAINAPTRAVWGKVVELIHECAEIRDRSLSPTEEARLWIASYLQSEGFDSVDALPTVDVTDSKKLHAAIAGADPKPFKDNAGRVCLRVVPLQKHVTAPHIGLGQRASLPDITQRLAALHFDKWRAAARRKGAPRAEQPPKPRLWCSPPGFDPWDGD